LIPIRSIFCDKIRLLCVLISFDTKSPLSPKYVASCVLASHFPGFFNAIQVDAPCSGEGMFRKLPEAIEQWSMENPESYNN
jgi:16S rRNA C967 or C1407 C5-methylase (RsmB/RsmF family)